MSVKVEAEGLLLDLDRVARVRHQMAQHLDNISGALSRAEVESSQASGKLELDGEIQDLNLTSQNLRQGVFRLLVLGDIKRGKSTLLNALIGENLLPSDVSPCTALLTVLRYGPEKQVTVYFKGDRPPERLDFTSFRQKYTIDPSEAKQLEEVKQLAFPQVSHAVVEYPLPFLEKGVEIVDSPGLNDTEARNELSLSYINNCHAVLFVFRASQPCTLDERRYLENYLKDRGLTVFFLINAWDEIRKSLVDLDDADELREAEAKLRQVFRTNLAEYCRVDGQDLYNQRVFELSSLDALRRRLKDAADPLTGTGFPEFEAALSRFLTQERAVAELRQATTLARQAYNHAHEAIARRIPLLDQDVQELKERLKSVEPEFAKLNEIRDQFQAEIRELRDRKAKEIATDFCSYILNLGTTFDTDFLRYQPGISFWDFLSQGRREEFNAACRQAFERYINEKIVAWQRTAEQEISTAFAELGRSAASYGTDYNRITDTITEKLIGQTIYTGNASSENNSPTWARWAMGFFSLTSGNIAGVFLAGAGFDWKNILVNYIAVIGITSFLALFTGAFIGPIGIMLVGLGIGALQLDQARQEFVKATKKEFVKHLPDIARDQWNPINQLIKDCFDAYEREVMKRINDDIQARRAELDNLVAQKESHEINREAEAKRLQALDAEVLSEIRTVESVYNSMLLLSV
ncbi:MULTISPECIES: dynamin family protein [Trichocoleus]|uniref:Dynamin family protein n=1 Tax=Trichocoleus desertorum GB2-A4 TaxID=2933944 RepID=A0ABV0JBK5_9CYAN|nr:dynamin family protein [Trichocoleus sp. FACHB-46]MBD1862819.1 dynamin family protein [Trichocoleus sp. FACHB-46]